MTTWTKPGEFNRRITIQKINGYTQDSNGDDQPTWIDFFAYETDVAMFSMPLGTQVVTPDGSIAAKISIQSGKEFWASRKVNAEWDGLFKIRYSAARAAIKPTMRVIYGSRTFNITNVYDSEEAHREIWIEAKEVI